MLLRFDRALSNELDKRRDALEGCNMSLRRSIVGRDREHRLRRLRLSLLVRMAQPGNHMLYAAELRDSNLIERIVIAHGDNGRHKTDCTLMRHLTAEYVHKSLDNQQSVLIVLCGQRRQRAARFDARVVSTRKHQHTY